MIKLAKNAGFCFGVKRAINLVNDELEKTNKNIYSIGPIIHNEIVINDLKNKGLIVLDEDKIKNIKNEIVVIRSHGIEKNNYEELVKNNNKIIDCTCPFVQKIHNLVEDYDKKGYFIVIIGDKLHPEVISTISYINSNNYKVVDTKDDILDIKIKKNQQIVVLFQTTANVEKSKKLVDILKKLFYNECLVIDTICNATIDRQNEVDILSKQMDLMIIIGSKNSSNTKKLYDVSKSNCENTFLINDMSEFNKIKINKYQNIGISAGASTPDYLIEEIFTNVRTKF